MKTDIWSLGALFFEMLTGHPPFQSKNMKQLEKDLAHGAYTLQIPNSTTAPSIEALHLLSSTLIVDETVRLSSEQLINHPYTNLSLDLTMVGLHDSQKKHEGQRKLRKALKVKFLPNKDMIEITLSCSKDKVLTALSSFLKEAYRSNALTPTVRRQDFENSNSLCKRHSSLPALVVHNGTFEAGEDFTVVKDSSYQDIVVEAGPFQSCSSNIIIDEYFKTIV